MKQLPPKKRVPELKLKKLPVTEAIPKRTTPPALSSVTTMVDGIPIIEYICERPSTIFLDSGPSSPSGEQTVSYFSPEPVKNQFFETDARTDVNVALKKPTRWDSGPRKSFRPESKKVVADSNFNLKPRDPRVKTFRKHHRQASEQREGGGSFQFDENLMDVSSPEYNPPSPFSPLAASPKSPKVAFDSKFPKRRTGFFDSESECSETEISRESNLYRILPTSVGRPPQYTGGEGERDERKYFWDSSSGEEGNDTDKKDSVISIKEVTPEKSVNYSSDDITQTVYKKSDTKPPRPSVTSNLRELNTEARPRNRIPLLSATTMNDCYSNNIMIRHTCVCYSHEYGYECYGDISTGTGANIVITIDSHVERREYTPKRHSVCIYCGDRGHASNDTCPIRVCSLCFKIGHNFRECKARGKNRPPKCNRCRISCHEKNRCGEIWRQCHNTTILPNDYPQCAKGNSYVVTMEIQAFRIDQLKSNLYCCNCASFGHVFFQCETPHPSRYFYIPLIGHHDIPLSVPFREIRDNAKKSLLLTSLLPKPYNVVSQNFWGDGNWNDDCDCLDGSGCQANWTSSAARKEKEIVRHFIETESDSSPIKSPRLTSSMADLENMTLSSYPLLYERHSRAFYGRNMMAARGFFTMPHFSYQPPDRRQLTPLIYSPDRDLPPVSVSKEEEKRSRLDTKLGSREDKRAHASFSQTVNNNKYDKHYKLKQRNLKVREKRKFDLKEKKVKKHFQDARECINRNRTKRQTQQHVRLSRSDDVTRNKNSLKRRSSPKRSVKKTTPERKSGPGSNEQPTSEETYMFVDEVN